MTAMLEVDRKDIRHARWREAADGPLGEGMVRFRIDRFALTSNNVTYAAFGEAMGYWKFFPTGAQDTGCIPVWGFATAVEARCVGIEVGERFYGFLPMADAVVLQPERVDSVGFLDGAPHRRELHGTYNQYLRCSTDAFYQRERETLLPVLRPLFMTSFLIDDFLADENFFAARSVLISSASSKTAFALGFLLSARGAAEHSVRSVGLTSATNLAFAQRLGCYDEVMTYDQAVALPPNGSAVYVDMSGDAAFRAMIHGQLGDRLAYSCSVGGTHWEALGGGRNLPGPRPVLFFAPAQVKKRIGEWGLSGLQAKVLSAWQQFIERVTDPTQPWLVVRETQGRNAVLATYFDVLEGRVSPDEAHVLTV